MTIPAADRVRVEWSGTGTGTMTLGSAVAGFQGFPSGLNGQIVSYAIEHTTSSEAEAGFGTYTSAGNTLSRTYRTYPTPGGAAVSFSAGVKHVRLTATHFDIFENRATTDPTTSDDINDGYIEGRTRWLNTVDNGLFFLTDHAANAAVWIKISGGAGAVSSVNGFTGAVVLDATDINVDHGAVNYTPVGSPGSSVNMHLTGIDTALGAISAGADQAPTKVISNASPFALSTTQQLSDNVEIVSHQASVDFEVATTAAAGAKWYIRFQHDSCTVSVNTNAGSVNGTNAGAAIGINGGIGIVEVDTNAGSAPVVLVRGDIIIAPITVGGVKTYDNDDAHQNFKLTTTSTQTFSAASNYAEGFYVNLFATTGTTTLDGLDADYSAVAPDAVTVMKIGTALWAFGKHASSPVILDAA